MAHLFVCLTPWLKWLEHLGTAGPSPYVSNLVFFVARQTRGTQTYYMMAGFPQSECSEKARRNASPLKTRLRTGQHYFCCISLLKAVTGKPERVEKQASPLNRGNGTCLQEGKELMVVILEIKLPHCSKRREYMYMDTTVWGLRGWLEWTIIRNTFQISSFHLGYSDNSSITSTWFGKVSEDLQNLERAFALMYNSLWVWMSSLKYRVQKTSIKLSSP